MKFRSLLLVTCSFFLGTFGSVSAAILPSDRTIDWTAVGVTGGIPTRATISQTVDVAYGNDSTDAKAHIQAKINATTAGTVCYIPAGTYRVSGDLVVPSNITIRGAGIDVTIIKSTGTGNGTFSFGQEGATMQYYPNAYSNTLSAGNTKGSTSITVTNFSNLDGLSVGDLVVITGLNDGTTVTNTTTANGTAGWVDGWGTATGYTGGTRNRGQVTRITNMASTTLTLETPLFAAYPTPWITRFYAQGPKGSGVEDLTVYATNSGVNRNFYFSAASDCWLKNVKGDFCDGDQVTLDWSYRCEIRHSHFKEAFVHTSGTYDNMIGLRLKTTGVLVVDNIIERLHISVCTEWGAAGNVIAYNYLVGEYDDSEAGGNRALQMSMNANHGAHPQFNLFEGNVTSHFVADSFWGTSSHGVALRNWIKGHATSRSPYSTRSGSPGTPYELDQARRALDLWQGQSSYAALGNILGDSTTTGSTTTDTISYPASRPYDTQKYLRSFGYATTSDSGNMANLANPATTLIDHGNYSFKTVSQTWDPSIADHAIPNSLVFASKPSFFGTLAWPAYDPANPGTPTGAEIPAGYRYINGNEGYLGGDTTAPTVTITVPTSSTTYSQSAAALTISGTASDETALSSVTVTMSGATTGSVTITGTTSWSGSTTLNAGATTLTATATDSSSNTATDTLTVTYTPVTSSTRTAPAPRYPRGNHHHFPSRR